MLQRILKYTIGITIVCSATIVAADSSIEQIVNEIKELEKQRDPKCYATATRLEGLMFGTPLSDKSRFKKNLLQKAWAKNIWSDASKASSDKGSDKVLLQDALNSINKIMRYEQNENGHWEVFFSSGQELQINKDDKRQYSTVAYALRAILAVQQESLFEDDIELLAFDEAVIDEFKKALDLLSLSVLKISDARAREKNEYEVTVVNFDQVWGALIGNEVKLELAKSKEMTAKVKHKNNKADLGLVKKIISQKVESYAAYNSISQQLFVRNLQVYFARVSWPKEPEKAKAFQNLYVESLIQFAIDLYQGAEKIAKGNGHSLILEGDVAELIGNFIPHDINEYEDATFFPKLDKQEQLAIEAYDMDAFRDSGLHWRYLEYAINSESLNPQLEPDPFALELMVENIAQFGVLSLRVAGINAKDKGVNRISSELFVEGLKEIQSKINEHAALKDSKVEKQKIISASSTSLAKNKNDNNSNRTTSSLLFSDITQDVEFNYMHRSSNWLNRLLRSYLDKGKGVGIITIPPAFGGSGVAAEDINNDGYVDLLILGGLGNKLYLNDKGKKFVDISESSGIGWKREEDGSPGESRQPIIADLNNDGLQDIVITYVNDEHRVYQNIDGITFKDVTDIANLGGEELVGGPATVADFDNDGLLDIYVSYFGHYTKGVLPTLKRRNDNGLPNQLFRNVGGFKFENITKGSGADHTGWAQAIGHTDLDGDGLQDIIVGNDFGVNAYLKNLGNNQFKDIAAELGTDKPSYTMSIGITDLNRDLRPDIYISNIVTMNKDEKYVLPNEDMEMKFNADKLAKMRVVEANDLFLSKLGKESSYELSNLVGRGYSSTGWSWDADFFDFDNDSDEDLYVLNGMNEFNLYSSENPYYTDPNSNEAKNVYIPVATKESNVFFTNKDGKLINISKNSGLDLVGNSRSAAYLDFDLDGDLDIVVNNYHEKAYFYQNNLMTNRKNWIQLKLVGDPKKNVNRDAIGAKIIVHTQSGLKIWKEVHSTIGYMSVHPKTQHIGLGDELIDRIEVVWPNGDVQLVSGLKKGERHTVNQTGSSLAKVN